MSSINDTNSTEHSQPIPIEGHHHNHNHHSRRRAQSVSDSSDSSVSPSSPITPSSPPYPRSALPPISPSTSPILSYFLAQSPNKSTAATFPFRRGFGAPPLVEDDEEGDVANLASRHARRASTNTWGGSGSERFAPPPTVPVSTEQQDRAAGLLRRLSLGGAMTRNSKAPNSGSPPAAAGSAAGAGAMRSSPARKTRRATTMGSVAPKQPRAPSPMGERILKGHFDGFN